jgi:superoxide reductase
MKPDSLDKLFQSDDWKTEKHAPVIEIQGGIQKNVNFKVEVSVGKEIEHPNLVEHHIRWIELYFLPEGRKIPQQLGTFDFTSHGEGGSGEEAGVYTHPCVATSIRVNSNGTLLAASYCNIHGLWQTAREVVLEA